MSSATARASTHLRASRSLVERPMLIRSMMLAALSWPSASTNTLRRNSSVPTPTEVSLSTDWLNCVMTVWTSSRETFASFDMAEPMRCTSFAPMCLRTWAASCSPNVSRRIAALSVPVRVCSFSFTARYFGLLVLSDPAADHLGHALGILVGQGPGLCYLLLVGEHGFL